MPLRPKSKSSLTRRSHVLFRDMTGRLILRPSRAPVGTSSLRVASENRWHAEEELEANERWRFLLGIWGRLCAVHMNDVRLVGVYANGQSFGQDSPIHRDNLPSEPGQTAVLFCNDYWATTWQASSCSAMMQKLT